MALKGSKLLAVVLTIAFVSVLVFMTNHSHADSDSGGLRGGGSHSHAALDEHLIHHSEALRESHDALHQEEAHNLQGALDKHLADHHEGEWSLKALFQEHLAGHEANFAAAHGAMHGEGSEEFGRMPAGRRSGAGGGSDPLAGRPRPQILPPIRADVNTKGDNTRKSQGYGGTGDGLHLGGFKANGLDHEGISNNTWNFMMGRLGVRSLVDVGCGKGVSTNYFREAGADVLCVEGSHDANQHSLLPSNHIVEHDYTRGPWWPEKTYDALWCVDVLEHIGRQYHENLLPTLQQSALLFLAASNNGGWHHSEVRQPWWWRAKMESMGFIFSQELTDMVRDAALATSVRNSGGRIIRRMLVFINPEVARRPEHLHLFSSDGCIYEDRDTGVPCTDRFSWFSQVDLVPKPYQALVDCTFHKKEVDDSVAQWPSFLDKNKEHPAYGTFECIKNKRAFD
jgi:2-polyprenyl-3-methyl-5-hydroxy-6-metoxy-1,4-benzoquinol methylase